MSMTETETTANTLDSALKFLLEQEWRRWRKRQAMHEIIERIPEPESPEIRHLIAEEQEKPRQNRVPDGESQYLVIDKVHHDLRRGLDRAAEELWPGAGQPAKAPSTIWIPMAELHARNKTLKPTAISFSQHDRPDDTYHTKTWGDALVAVVQWLVKEGRITRDHLPITILKEKRPAIRDRREGMKSPREVDEGIYIDNANDYQTQIRRVRALLEKNNVGLERCMITFHPLPANTRLPRRPRAKPAPETARPNASKES